MQVPVIIGILTTLLSNKMCTAEQLAEKYEISKRTVYRYLDVLSQAGVPLMVRHGRNGGWGIIDNYRLSSMYFTKDEYKRALLAVKSFSLQDDVTQSVADKLQGINREFDNVGSSEKLIVDGSAMEGLQEKITILQHALENNLTVSGEYHSKEGVTRRSLEPYSMIFKDGSWYVYCFCRLRNDFRYFKVARFAELHPEGERFIPRRFSVDVSLLSGVSKRTEYSDVILTVSGSALTEVEEWLGIGHVAKLGDDYVAKARLPIDDYLVGKLLSFGAKVKVESPEPLRNKIVEACTAVRETYGM